MAYADTTAAQGNRNVRWSAVPLGGIADYNSPTLAEINAGVDITDAVKTDGMDFDTQASGSIDDRSHADSASVQYRDFSDFGGHLPIYYPLVNDDGTYQEPDGAAALTKQAIGTPRTVFYLVERVLQGGVAAAFAAGDMISVYKVMTDARTKDTMTSGAGYTYTINLLPQGDIAVNTLVKTAVAPVYSNTTASVAVGALRAVTAALSGKNITQGAEWVSTDPEVASVTANGVIKGVGAGTATITATHPAVGAADTGVAVTVTGP